MFLEKDYFSCAERVIKAQLFLKILKENARVLLKEHSNWSTVILIAWKGVVFRIGSPNLRNSLFFVANICLLLIFPVQLK